jgi:hypothetical protein
MQFHSVQGIYRTAEKISASHEGMYSMDLLRLKYFRFAAHKLGRPPTAAWSTAVPVTLKGPWPSTQPVQFYRTVISRYLSSATTTALVPWLSSLSVPSSQIVIVVYYALLWFSATHFVPCACVGTRFVFMQPASRYCFVYCSTSTAQFTLALTKTRKVSPDPKSWTHT